jgi:transcriptional regulator with XRE-family HTH domain
MTIFDANRESQNYPQQLREIRQKLKLSQTAFAAAAGYSGVMQGRYETKRGNSNSATPSEKTAKAIKSMIESISAKANDAASDHVEVRAVPVQSLKSVSVLQIEQAIKEALRTLTGAPYEVEVKDVAWEGISQRGTEISLVVTSGSMAV